MSDQTTNDVAEPQTPEPCSTVLRCLNRASQKYATVAESMGEKPISMCIMISARSRKDAAWLLGAISARLEQPASLTSTGVTGGGVCGMAIRSSIEFDPNGS